MPVQHHTITWNFNDLLWIGPLVGPLLVRKNFSEILIVIQWSIFFPSKLLFENVVCQMGTILHQPQCVRRVGLDMGISLHYGLTFLLSCFRDASFGICTYNLTLLDCLLGINKVRDGSEWTQLLIIYKILYIGGLVQDCNNSSALAMELLQSCTKPSIYW